MKTGIRGNDTARFWSYVDKKTDDECWEWIGYKRPDGYGDIGIGGRKGKNIRAHRYSWELHYGKIPAFDKHYGSMLVCHTCDNPSCVNPNHLFLGTPEDNMQDKIKKGRHVTPFRLIKGEEHHTVKVPDYLVKFVRILREHTDKSYVSTARMLNDWGYQVTATTVRRWNIGEARQ